MPDNKPIPVSQLPPIADSAADVVELKERIRAVQRLLCFGIALIVPSQFQPLARYFNPTFPWIMLGAGGLMWLFALVWIFKGRESMIKTDEKKLAYLFGVVFVVVLLVIAIAVPNPTTFQYTVFRIVLALAAAGVAAMIPGFLEVAISNWIRAGGALAIFVIVYFYSPAALVTQVG